MIRQLRERKGLTQSQLGDMVGKSYQLIQRWENGKGKPTTSQLSIVADALDISVLELLKLAADGGSIVGSDMPVTAEQETRYITGNVSRVRPRLQSQFVEVPFLSARAQAGPASVLLMDCNPDTGETHPVLADLVDKRYKHLVLQVDGYSMEPSLLSGSRILAQQVEADRIQDESGGIFAVYYADRLVVKRIRTNDLREKGTLTLHSDNELYGATTIQQSEIRCIWKILCKIYEPVR